VYSPSPLSGTPQQPCPCWTQRATDLITKDNVSAPGAYSCFFHNGELCLLSRQSDGFTNGFCATATDDSCELFGWDTTPGLGPTRVSKEQAGRCVQQIKDRCAEIGYPAPSANQDEMKTFEQQVSVAQGKDTRASGHAESKSNTKPPECSTLGIAGTPEGCTTYCTDKNLGSSSYGIIGDGTVTCSCTLDGTTTNVCIRSPPGPNTEGKPCTDIGITDWKTCRDYCLPASTLTKFGDDAEIVSCTCGSIDGVTTEPFSCTTTTSSSSALSLLLPGAVVTVTTYLITMGI